MPWDQAPPEFIGSATPELREKLHRQLERAEGGPVGEVPRKPGRNLRGWGRRTKHISLDFEDDSDDPEVSDESTCSDATSSDSEPLEYALLAAASKLPPEEASSLLKKAKRIERHRNRTEESLRTRLRTTSVSAPTTPSGEVTPGAKSSSTRRRSSSALLMPSCTTQQECVAEPLSEPQGGIDNLTPKLSPQGVGSRRFSAPAVPDVRKAPRIENLLPREPKTSVDCIQTKVPEPVFEVVDDDDDAQQPVQQVASEVVKPTENVMKRGPLIFDLYDPNEGLDDHSATLPMQQDFTSNCADTTDGVDPLPQRQPARGSSPGSLRTACYITFALWTLAAAWLLGSRSVRSGSLDLSAAPAPMASVSSARAREALEVPQPSVHGLEDAQQMATRKAKELAQEKAMQQELRRQVETAAERMARGKQELPSAHAVIEERVKEMEKRGYKVLLRPEPSSPSPAEDGSSSRDLAEAEKRSLEIKELLTEKHALEIQELLQEAGGPPAHRVASLASKLSWDGVSATQLLSVPSEELASMLSSRDLGLSEGERLRTVSGLRMVAERRGVDHAQ